MNIIDLSPEALVTVDTTDMPWRAVCAACRTRHDTVQEAATCLKQHDLTNPAWMTRLLHGILCTKCQDRIENVRRVGQKRVHPGDLLRAHTLEEEQGWQKMAEKTIEFAKSHKMDLVALIIFMAETHKPFNPGS